MIVKKDTPLQQYGLTVAIVVYSYLARGTDACTPMVTPQRQSSPRNF